MKPSRQILVSSAYFVLGQAGWFACVLGAAHGLSFAGIAVVALLILAHLACVRRPWPEVRLIVAVAALGAAWDTGLVVAGLLSYPHDGASLHHAPYWIIALWALFAAQLNVVYRWLQTRLAWASLLGAVAGPLSFRAGAALQVVRFELGWRTVAVLAIGWALLVPVAVLLARRWDGVGTGPARA